MSYFILFAPILFSPIFLDDKYYPSGSILDSRENLFSRNKTTRSLPIKWRGKRDRNSFLFFFKHVKHNHASSDYEIRDSVPVQSPRNIWGVDRRPNRTSANE